MPLIPKPVQTGSPILSAPVPEGAGGGAAVDLSSYASQYPASVIAAAQNIFATQPDQLATFQGQFGGDLSTWLNSFTQWWSNNGSQAAGNMQQYAPEANLLQALGYSPGQNGNWVAGPNAVVQAPPLGSNVAGSGPASTSVNEPAEEGIYDESIGGLNNEVLNDQNLAVDTTNLQNENLANYGALGGVLSQAIAPPGGLSAVTKQENTAATTAASAQLSALSQSIASMQGALTGTLAAQAAALQTAIQQQLQNSSTYGDAASQALAQQIQTQLGDLQTSIGQQQTALQTQISQLSGQADTSSQQQMAALQTELQQLNAAEAPVADAVTKAAQAQVTAVNIGEAQAKNTIQGEQQLQGFVGGSSELDNALAQAGIGAQQAAAADVGNAAVTNAQAYQDIANEGAQSQSTLADTLAQEQEAIAGQGTTGQYNLATALASGTQNLADTGASGKAAIANTVAQQEEGVQNTGSQQQYQNTVQGLTYQDQLANALAQGQENISNTEAQQQEANVQNQYQTSLQAALANAALPNQEAGSLAATDSLQNAGLTNAQNALNWWTTSTAAPNPTTTTQTASNAGNAIGQAGAGLLNAATSIGNSQHWWQAPATSSALPASDNADIASTTADTAATEGLFCWIAREVYGSVNPKWLMFRRWMLESASENLFNLYLRHGERIAAKIRNDDGAKDALRSVMDRILVGA